MFVQGLGRYGCMGVGLGAVLVGDKLYGYRGGLLARVEGVGWLPVVWVAPSLRQRVRAQSQLRALCRLERYGWALRERYRTEQVFGNVKRAYGSYLGCRGAERGVERVGVWGVGVAWLLCVGWVDGWCALGRVSGSCALDFSGCVVRRELLGIDGGLWGVGCVGMKCRKLVMWGGVGM